MFAILMVAILGIGFASCSSSDDEDDEDEEKVASYIITAELVSSSSCPADFAGYVRSLCNSVHKSIKGNRRSVYYEFDVIESDIMQSLFRYDSSYDDKNYTIAFLAKDTSGDIKYRRSMIVGNGKINNYDTEY